MQRTLLVVLACPLLVPTAAAGDLFVELVIPHGPDEPMKLSRTAELSTMTVEVQVTAKDFVCPQGATVAIDLDAAYPHEWAGASFQPSTVNGTIGSPGPGIENHTYSIATTTFEMKWGENTPRVNASIVYTITTDTQLGGVCLPGVVLHEASAPMGAYMEDAPPGPDPEDLEECQNDPGRPGCATILGPATPPGAPGVSFLLALGAAFTGARLRKRG